MEKDKLIKIVGGATIALAIGGASIYGLSQTKGNPIYGFFNNSANEQSSGKTEKVEESKKKTKEERAENLADSEQSLTDARNSKFEMNRKIDWSPDDILKTPVDDDYVYK